MPLPNNPLTRVVQSASNIAGSFANKINGGSLPPVNDAEGKANLDATVNRLSGGIGSPLNGATAGPQNIVGALGAAAGQVSNIAGDIGRTLNRGDLTGGALGSLGAAAGAISGVAGGINNLLGSLRGANLPSGGELFKRSATATSISSAPVDDWRVRINCNFGLLGNGYGRLISTGGVVWPYNPKISINSKANYNALDLVHNNYPFPAYKNSKIEEINISGDFTCETESDASYWIAATTFFKAATKMFFGASAYAGNPPIVCQLNGYGPGVFNSVPVVITSFTMDLPEDVNYIRCNTSSFGTTWAPIVSNVSVTVMPIYNRTKLRKFSLQDYGSGKMTGYI
jgi:hypothetical protein